MVSLEQAASEGENGEVRSMVEMLEARESSPLDQTLEGENREQVRACVDKLPEFLRQVVVLVYYQGLKYREVADILGVPVGTVKFQLHSSLKLQESWTRPPPSGNVKAPKQWNTNTSDMCWEYWTTTSAEKSCRTRRSPRNNRCPSRRHCGKRSNRLLLTGTRSNHRPIWSFARSLVSRSTLLRPRGASLRRGRAVRLPNSCGRWAGTASGRPPVYPWHGSEATPIQHRRRDVATVFGLAAAD